MTLIEKTALRAARCIRQQIDERWRTPGRASFPDSSWHNTRRVMRQIDIARQRGWHAAARQLNSDLVYEVECCQQRLGEFARQLQQQSIPKNLPTESDIFREIMALYDDFPDAEIDLHSREISVTTEPIVLEDTHLGPFQIRLDWNRLGSHQPYRVVALDPHPSAANAAVTHPHIQDEGLCEGEGRAGIASALSTGRLFDFFLIVSRLLDTYARGSAYVELDDWDGIRCQDCGSTTGEDDRYRCDRCEAELCGECCSLCHGCERSLCSECMRTCHCCGENYCRACLEACRKCHENFCEHCLEEGLCENCHDQQQDDLPNPGTDGSADAPADTNFETQRFNELLENTCRDLTSAGTGAAV